MDANDTCKKESYLHNFIFYIQRQIFCESFLKKLEGDHGVGHQAKWIEQNHLEDQIYIIYCKKHPEPFEKTIILEEEVKKKRRGSEEEGKRK